MKAVSMAEIVGASSLALSEMMLNGKRWLPIGFQPLGREQIST